MEKQPNREIKIQKNEVLELLKTKGIENPEVKKLVVQWTIQQEEFATQEGTTTAFINFNIDRADLYLAIGDIEGALDALDDARRQAYQENEIEIYGQIMARMREI
ncbi:hypothetical protein IT399_00200 [Candidatus Nomurabacteria bacterium]|nr:hypothetical protein [Candidatus Nomurabacteria bacterium]